MMTSRVAILLAGICSFGLVLAQGPGEDGASNATLHIRVKILDKQAPPPGPSKRAMKAIEDRIRSMAKERGWSEADIQEQLENVRRNAAGSPSVVSETEELRVLGGKILVFTSPGSTSDTGAESPEVQMAGFDGKYSTVALGKHMEMKPGLDLGFLSPLPLLGFSIGEYPTIKVRSRKIIGSQILLLGQVLSTSAVAAPGRSLVYLAGGAIADLAGGRQQLAKLWVGDEEKFFECWTFDDYKEVGSSWLPTQVKYVRQVDDPGNAHRQLVAEETEYSVLPEALSAPIDGDFDPRNYAKSVTTVVDLSGQVSVQYPFVRGMKSYEEMKDAGDKPPPRGAASGLTAGILGAIVLGGVVVTVWRRSSATRPA